MILFHYCSVYLKRYTEQEIGTTDLYEATKLGTDGELEYRTGQVRKSGHPASAPQQEVVTTAGAAGPGDVGGRRARCGGGLPEPSV